MAFKRGITQLWKLWRHCCCRFGCWPLIIAPLVTWATILDLYSSVDCEFVRVNIGFTPSNSAWNQSSYVDLGLFHYQSESLQADILYPELLKVEGCRTYPQDFQSQFMEGDRTWDVARMMALVSGSAGMLATVSASRNVTVNVGVLNVISDACCSQTTKGRGLVDGIEPAPCVFLLAGSVITINHDCIPRRKFQVSAIRYKHVPVRLMVP